MLTLLIPGPKSPGKDIGVYLKPLIEDLKVLWDRKGVETIDVASGQEFNMRAMVLWTINDFPARSSLSGWSGQEALEGGPIRPQWMFPYERYMKKSPEIDTYWSQFKSLFPNKDMKEEFPDWFGSQIRHRYVDNDKDIECEVCRAQPRRPSSYLVDSNNEDLINVDDDGVDKMLPGPTTVTVEVRIPPSHHVPSGCMGCFANRGKGKRKPNLGGSALGRLITRDKTRNLSIKEITDTKGPVSIQFELRDKQTVMPLDDHVAHWSSYIEEVIRGVPLYYPYWLKVLKKRKAALITDIRTQFDLRPHMESPDWTKINVGIPQHLQKAYNTNKAAFKAQHWVIDPTTGTYNVEKIRRARPENITASEWDKGRAQPLRSTCRSLTPSSWHTLLTGNSFMMRTDEEMMRLEATGTYIDDEINRLARGGNQRGHILGVGRVLPARATASPSTPAHQSTLNSLHKKVEFMMSLFKSDLKYSDMFSQFESGGASGSDGCGDEEEGADHQDDEDKDGGVSPTTCRRGICATVTLIYCLENMWDPPFRWGLSLGKKSLVRVPQRTFPSDNSPGKHIPSDKSLGKAGNCRWGRGLML
nr:F-box domain, leucine-rich repeat domain, L domain-like protein [Tanacetum cinerariifolium]